MKIVYIGQMAIDHNRDALWIDVLDRSKLTYFTFPTYPYERDLTGIVGKIKTRLHVGRVMKKMRCDLIDLVVHEKPDWVHFRLPLHFDIDTLSRIKNTGAVVTNYYNDDPFSEKRILGLHKMFIKAIPIYDAHFVFREKNIEEFKAKGAKRVYHCPPFYDPNNHKYIPAASDHNDCYDAVFIGHWENDGRCEYIEALVSAGYKVKVAGPLWDKVVKKKPLHSIGPFTPVFGEEYSRLYARAKAGICFFSKINSDQWTRRPLEIVASGGLLVCERTNEALMHFTERKEAFFFSSIPELISVMRFIINYPDMAEEVRKGGQKRLAENHDTIDSRIEMMLSVVREIRGE